MDGSRLRRLPALLVAGVLLAPGAEAQDLHLRSGIDLVAVNVTVRDGGDREGPALGVDDFEVLENGRAQTIAHLSRHRAPMLLTLVVDGSQSMATHLASARAGARELLRLLQPGDLGAVVDGSGALRQAPTAEAAALDQALSAIAVGGTTSVYDALWRAAELASSRAAVPGRTGLHPIVVLLSDGGDTSSARTLGEALAALRASGTTVYAAPPRRDPSPAAARVVQHLERARRRVLGRITEVTGGRVIDDPAEPGDGSLAARLSRELTPMYLLAYSPQAPPAPDAQVTVRLKRRRAPVVVLRPTASAHGSH